MSEMTLKEAVENGYDLLQTSSREKSPKSWDTLKLLIEAGKLVESLRVGVPRHVIRLLPGETRK